MSYLSSVIKSINVYSGSISCAASFSGTKDVTITSVVPGKSIILPYKNSNPTTANGNTTCVATSDNGNLTFSDWVFNSNTTVRFNTVANADSGFSHNINYAFAVVEFR